MNTILFKSLALAVIGTSVSTSVASNYAVNQHLINHQQKVNWPDNNPVYLPYQHDSQGADTVTLSNMTSTSFHLNYTLSAATLSYFYPAIGQFVNPSLSLFELLTQGSAWAPTTHYWQPLAKENDLRTFINANLYDSYLTQFQKALYGQFYYTNADTPATVHMINLVEAMQSGSALQISAYAEVRGGSVSYVSIGTAVIDNHYPASAKKEGVNAVFGNMNEPNNVLKVHISALSSQYIYEHYRDNVSGFMYWLFNKNQPGFAASTKLDQYINNDNNTRGYKYLAQKAEAYWATPNYGPTEITMAANFKSIMQAAGNKENKYGITLVFNRDTNGDVHLKVQKQKQAYRTVYENQRKVYIEQDDYAFLNVQDEMAFRLAVFRYLTPSAGGTIFAWANALNWLFATASTWKDADVVHPYALGDQMQNNDDWASGIWNINYKEFDQFMAQAIVLNRGVVLVLHRNYQDPDLSTVTIINQYPASKQN